MALRDVVLEGMRELSGAVRLPPETWRVIIASMLTPNRVIELTGTYGVAKTTIALGIMKVFFSDVYEWPVKPIARLRETLTEFDVFWYVNVKALMSGEEEREVEPRPIVTAPFKFFNEIRRGSPKVYQVMLALLAEGELEYRGRVYRSEPFFCIMDSNPKDTASFEMPKAIIDRIDARIPVGAPDPLTSYAVLRDRARGWRHALDELEPLMTSRDVSRVWAETSRVEVPAHCSLFLSFVHASMQCAERYRMPIWGGEEEIEIDRTLAEGGFQLPCEQCRFNGNLCSRIAEAWGMRWMLSATRIAVGLAWLDGRQRVGLRDIVSVLPYVLNHRLVIKEGSRYPNTFTFLSSYLPALIRTSGEAWARAAHLLPRALRGSREALRELEEIASRDPAVQVVYRSVRRHAP
jgi:MoxR-like ATPase